MQRAILFAAGLSLFGIATAAAEASDPTGIYALIEKVVFEPNESKPERVQLWGWFELADEAERRYGQPTHGCLYYRLEESKADLCRREWKDLKQLAGSGKCVAFGARYAELGSVLGPKDKLSSPTPYPLAAGLFAIRDNSEYPPVAALMALPLAVLPLAGDLVEPGAIELKAMKLRGKRHARAQYVFEIAAATAGEREQSAPVAAEEGKTAVWKPALELKPGERYLWRVRAVDGDWQSEPAETAFTVKGRP